MPRAKAFASTSISGPTKGKLNFHGPAAFKGLFGLTQTKNWIKQYPNFIIWLFYLSLQIKAIPKLYNMVNVVFFQFPQHLMWYCTIYDLFTLESHFPKMEIGHGDEQSISYV